MLKILALVLILIGVTLVYDARKITKKLFKFGNENDASMGFKLFGFILSVGGALILYFI